MKPNPTVNSSQTENIRVGRRLLGQRISETR
jgi:hypothetical protein